MLQVKDISKKYITGNLEQMALDGVSLNLRDNEFVAILGPSGSGKTTLLNIIGGLDRYDGGDLIINGVTTKKYKDRDWDSYRNHTVGFVFQSYNLIPHQTVLANVELALTISGITRGQRKHKAHEALKKVGLEEHMHKKPNQLSGGQMQRVAIARALVNDPDILLADEPTGALDSETSLQVMDLLKEVARDRLVVMVTHNPELAEQYATRIVTLKDGRITSDSDPFVVEEGEGPVHKNLGKAHMSFLTALTLSFNNLWTKKARTILVAFAGSIGIIGIAMILSLSNGVNKYIEDTETETLSEYPLDIQKTSFDLSSFMGYEEETETETQDPTEASTVSEGSLQEIKIVSDMFSTMDSNDLVSLKKYLDDNKKDLEKYARAVEYSYSLTPWIFLEDYEGIETSKDKMPVQVSPSTLNSAYGGEMQAYSMMGINMDIFRELPSDPSLYIDGYDVMAGRWPETSEEAVLVVTGRKFITDYMLYSLGIRNPSELDKMIKAFSEGKIVEVSESENKSFDFDDFLGITYKVVPAYKKYSYDSRYKVWTDKSDDKEYMKSMIAQGKELKIVGVACVKETARTSFLTPGIRYLDSLTYELMEEASESEIVKEQLGNRKTNVLTGKDFSDEGNDNLFDMESMFSVDENAFANAFNFNQDALNLDSLDMSGMDFSNLDMSSMDFSNMDFSNMDLSSIDPESLKLDDIKPEDFQDLIDVNSLISAIPEPDPTDLLSLFDGVKVDVTAGEMLNIFNTILDDYQTKHGEELEEIAKGIEESLRNYLTSNDFRSILEEEMKRVRDGIKLPELNQKDLADMVDRIMAGFAEFAQGYNPQGDKTLQEYLEEYLASGKVQEIISKELAMIQGKIDEISIPDLDVDGLVSKITSGYDEYRNKTGGTDIKELYNSFSDYLNSEETRTLIRSSIEEYVDTEAIRKKIGENAAPLMSKYLEPIQSELGKSLTGAIGKVMENYMGAVMKAYSSAMEQVVAKAMEEFARQFGTTVMTQVSKNLTDAFAGLFENMGDAFSLDEEALAGAFKFNMTEKELTELMTSMLSSGKSTYESNLASMGYASEEEPIGISIYPISFESKEGIIECLERYNKMMEESGQEEKVVRYTDIVGTLMKSVTDIVNSISYVLIAFVAISLVVSSIMIGVITYISVLERRKEIGILRAIGASKRNISGVFNAETFIIGLLAGLFGVGIARLLLIPANYIIHALSTADSLNAVLPLRAALLLVALSIVLTLIGGLIPSKKAAKSDPVTALRTE